jgi:hypothetical protein
MDDHARAPGLGRALEPRPVEAPVLGLARAGEPVSEQAGEPESEPVEAPESGPAEAPVSEQAEAPVSEPVEAPVSEPAPVEAPQAGIPLPVWNDRARAASSKLAQAASE